MLPPPPLGCTNPGFRNHCETAALLQADCGSAIKTQPLYFPPTRLRSYPRSRPGCLHFHAPRIQLRPWIHSEFDGVKHNKKDDFMGLRCRLALKPSCNFHYPKKLLLKCVSFYFPHASRSKGARKWSPRQLFRPHLERNEGLRLSRPPLKSSSFRKDERVLPFHNSK